MEPISSDEARVEDRGETSTKEDAQIEALSEQYLADLHAGKAPDRQALLSSHPDLAERLEPRLKMWELLVRSKTESDGENAESLSHLANLKPSADHPSQVGPYKVLQVLGEGGMAIVYLAEQSEPVQRRVALKIMKPGLGTDDALARFELERQALALMDHPAIAKVFDAGSTDEGAPCFVMEHVAGVPITQYCDDLCLRTSERLDLYLQVCDAVQHAHQKGIIHRDLKPTNVLVTGANGNATPKIIDFGIAKAVGIRLTEKTLHTEHGRTLGTPEYMSPEQAEGASDDVDTRTDIYSLGIILYELLVGVLPIQVKELREASLDEIRRRIREEETTKPSTRASDLGSTAVQVSEKRKTDPATHARLLRGDLDWIVMKALEKDRTRRYPTASELASDIERHLKGEPVLAGAPSRLYRLRKFVRKHRALVASVLAVALAIVAGFAVSTSLYLQAGEERDAAEEARQEAQRQADKASAINAYLGNMLSSVHPGREGRGLTVAELLHKAAQDIGSGFPDQPAVEVSLRATIGLAYLNLGFYDEAEGQIEAALKLGQDVLGGDRRETITAMECRGHLAQKRGRLRDAEQTYRAALVASRRVLGNEDAITLGLLRALGGLLLQEGKYEEAEPFLYEALESSRRVLGGEHPLTLRAMADFADMLRDRSDYQAARRLLDEVVRTSRRVLGSEHPERLGFSLRRAYATGSYHPADEIEQLYRQVLNQSLKTFGADHPNTLATMNDLAGHIKGGESAEAEELLLQALEANRRILGEEDPQTLVSINRLGWVRYHQGRYDEAEQLARQAWEARRRVLGDHHRDTLQSLHDIARAMERQERLSDAERVYRQVLEACRDALGEGHRITIRAWNELTAILKDQGKIAELGEVLRNRLEIHRDQFGEKSLRTLESMTALTQALYVGGKTEEGEAIWRQALDLWGRFSAEECGAAFSSMREVADGVWNWDSGCDLSSSIGRQLYEECLQLGGDDHRHTIMAGMDLAWYLRDCGNLDEAEALCRKYIEAGRRALGANHKDVLWTVCLLGLVHYDKGDLGDAETRLREAAEGLMRHPASWADWILLEIALLLHEEGRLGDAESMLRKTIDLYRHDGGTHWPNQSTLEAQAALALLLKNQGKLSEGERLAKEALEFAERLHRDDPWQGATKYRESYGACLMALERFEEAEPYLLEAFDGIRKVVWHEHIQARRSIQKLIDLYTAWGKPEKAKEFRAALSRGEVLSRTRDPD